jgi:hypothetical protein
MEVRDDPGQFADSLDGSRLAEATLPIACLLATSVGANRDVLELKPQDLHVLYDWLAISFGRRNCPRHSASNNASMSTRTLATNNATSSQF